MISPVQSKRLRAALSVAIPMDLDDIDRVGRSILEVGAFKRAIAAYVLFRLGYTGSQVAEVMNLAETSASQARTVVDKRAEGSAPFKIYLDGVLKRFDAKSTR